MQEHINNTQCRMAMAALGWSSRELARHSSVGATTIQRFVAGGTSNPSTLALLKKTLEEAGLMFIPADEAAGSGVRWQKPEGAEKSGESAI